MLRRLDQVDAHVRPLVWVTVGGSGAQVAQAIVKRADVRSHPWSKDAKIVPLGWDLDALVHAFQDPADSMLVQEAPILLIDSVVNSGITMLGALDFLNGLARPPRSIAVYTVAARHGSALVPNLFSISIGPSDRVFLPWHEQRPNNRLTMNGLYRSLRDSDLAAAGG